MIAAEGGDLDLSASLSHQNDSEMRSHLLRVGKQSDHFLRPSVGRDVEILGWTPQQQIAHATADKIRLPSARLQS